MTTSSTPALVVCDFSDACCPQMCDASRPRHHRRQRRRHYSSWAAVGAGAVAVLACSGSSPAASAFSYSLAPRARRPLLAMSATGGSGAGGRQQQLLPSSNALTRNSNSFSSATLSPTGTRLYADSEESTSMKLLDKDEFEMHVGKALDTLRSDYPVVLRKNPDFSIYDKNIEVIDPSGVKLHGLSNYKSSFRLMHAIVGIFYCPERSMVRSRICFDSARQNIRIMWNADVVPKAIFGGAKTTLHIDGISVYEISRVTGDIKQHRIERLVLNDSALTPKQGVIEALRGYAVKKKVDSIPIFNIEGRDQEGMTGNGLLEFRTFSPASTSSLLFSYTDDENKFSSVASTTSLGSSSSTLAGSGPNSAEGDRNVDWEALERKNASRKKFGLEPLSPEEYMELQEKVAEIDIQQQKRAAAAAATKMANEKSKKAQKGGFLKKLFGDAMTDTCESNFDCERPLVCCDFGVVKKCCASGARVIDAPRSRQGQLAEVPVIASPDNYPPPNDPRRRY